MPKLNPPTVEEVSEEEPLEPIPSQDEVPKSEIAFGYKLKGHDYVVSDKKEIDSAKPVSSKLIELDKFIEFFQVVPHYFEMSFLLIPNNSEKPYALLRKLLEKTGLAAIGKDDHEHHGEGHLD